jgi:nucleoside phosphorylase
MTVKLCEFHAMVATHQGREVREALHEEVPYMAPPRVTDILVVAAHPPELAGLAPLLGTSLRARVGSVEVAAEAVGIGLASAAFGTGRALRSCAPRCIVLVGTCGVYVRHGRDLGVGAVVRATRIHLASTAAVQGRGAFPAPMTLVAEPDGALSMAVGRSAHPVEVATTLAITTDDDLARRVGESLGCEVEHLEAFGVAAACAAEHVPLAAVLGVANRVGSAARDEWRRHHESAGKAATDVVAAWLSSGAPGLPLRT